VNDFRARNNTTGAMESPALPHSSTPPIRTMSTIGVKCYQ